MRLAFVWRTIGAASDIEAAITDEPEANLRDIDGVAVRVNRHLWETLSYQQGSVPDSIRHHIASVHGRIGEKILIVIPEGTEIGSPGTSPKIADFVPLAIALSKNGNGKVSRVAADDLDELREKDLENILTRGRSRCVISAPSSYHFVLPSGAHTSQFVRLAEALTDLLVVDRIAYWIAVEVIRHKDRTRSALPYRFIVDNPSMLVLAIRVGAMLGVDRNFECITSYPDNIDHKEELLSLLTRSISEDSLTWLLIGVTSTGGLQRTVESWAQESGKSHFIKSITIYALDEALQVFALCRPKLPDYHHFLPHTDCELCESRSLVRIDSSTYYVSTEHPRAIPLHWGKFFSDQNSFLKKFGDKQGVLRVHYEDPNEAVTRHHAFYVDVASLLKVEDFVTELRSKLRNIKPLPGLIVGPAHEAALRIGAIAEEELGAKFISHNSLRLDINQAIDREISERAKETHCILVIDDLFITGQHLEDYNRALREEKDHFGHVKHVHFMTMLAVPESDEIIKRRSSAISAIGDGGRSGSLIYLYKFALPNWSQKACPWCQEEIALKAAAQGYRGDLETPFDARLTELQDSRNGLANSCFLYLNPEQSSIRLGAQSPAVPAGSSAIQTLFYCASAVQQLRTAPPLRRQKKQKKWGWFSCFSSKPADLEEQSLDPLAFPAPRYLAKRVFSTNYTERLFWISLLRSLRPQETEQELKAYLSDHVKNYHSDGKQLCILRELALAGLRGHFQFGKTHAELIKLLMSTDS